MRYSFPVSLFLLLGREYLLLSISEPITLAPIIIMATYGLKWLHVFDRVGNFSYGIFPIHLPIIQIFIHCRLDQYSSILTLAFTTILSTGLGILSWKYIEKSCLYHPKKKNQMNAVLG